MNVEIANLSDISESAVDRLIYVDATATSVQCTVVAQSKIRIKVFFIFFLLELIV